MSTATADPSPLGIKMKRVSMLIIACVLLGGCAVKHDERLIGAWKSNKEKTVSEFNRRFPARFEKRPEMKEKFAEIFGYMTHTYTSYEITTDYKGNISTVKYKIIDQGKDYVVIRPIGGDYDDVNFMIKFEEDLQSYWFNSDTDLSENFTKIQ